MLLLLLGAPATAQDDAQDEPVPRDRGALAEGQWVQVKGQFDLTGTLFADEVELLEPDDQFVLVGTPQVVAYDKGRFTLNGFFVHTSDKTEWGDLDMDDLASTRVKVSGSYRSPRKFSAREISRRGKGRDSVEGRLDTILEQPEGLTLFIGSVRVLVPREAEFLSLDPVETYDLAPLDHVPVVPEQYVFRNYDDRIPGSFPITDRLRLGLLAEVRLEHEKNYDLDETKSEDRTDAEASLQTQLTWTPNANLTGNLRLRMLGRARDENEDGTETQRDAVLNAAWFYWRDVFDSNVDVQVGRQDFDEPREWIYDENLDAVRLIWPGPILRAELSLSTALSNSSPSNEASTNYMAYLSNGDYDRHIAGYVIDRRDTRDARDFPIHVGFRMFGDWLPQNESWLEASALRGYGTGINYEGWGFDLGTTWSPAFMAPFRLTVGYARGSGDDPDTPDVDESFRQTGLQDNNGRFAQAITSFRYYGELFDPELSNIGILTLGAGLQLNRSLSLDLVYHDYRQSVATDFQRNVGVGPRPSGLDPGLGQEFDVVFGARSAEGVDIKFVLGWFDPGAAYPDADGALLASMRVRYRF